MNKQQMEFELLKRCGGYCEQCGEFSNKLQLHHKREYSSISGYSTYVNVDDYEMLCKYCHSKKPSSIQAQIRKEAVEKISEGKFYQLQVNVASKFPPYQCDEYNGNPSIRINFIEIETHAEVSAWAVYNREYEGKPISYLNNWYRNLHELACRIKMGDGDRIKAMATISIRLSDNNPNRKYLNVDMNSFKWCINDDN